MEKRYKLCKAEGCDKVFRVYKSTDKYCSLSCALSDSKNKTIKKKKCNAEGCNNLFIPYRSTDKYCSRVCASRYIKPIVVKKNAFEKEFEKQKAKIISYLLKKHGKLICQKCGTDNSIAFSTHHIIYRSEYPNHSELNNKRNLIHLCYDCHRELHNKKESRNWLVSERELYLLFDNIPRYE